MNQLLLKFEQYEKHELQGKSHKWSHGSALAGPCGLCTEAWSREALTGHGALLGSQAELRDAQTRTHRWSALSLNSKLQESCGMQAPDLHSFKSLCGTVWIAREPWEGQGLVNSPRDEPPECSANTENSCRECDASTNLLASL